MLYNNIYSLHYISKCVPLSNNFCNSLCKPARCNKSIPPIQCPFFSHLSLHKPVSTATVHRPWEFFWFLFLGSIISAMQQPACCFSNFVGQPIQNIHFTTQGPQHRKFPMKLKWMLNTKTARPFCTSIRRWKVPGLKCQCLMHKPFKAYFNAQKTNICTIFLQYLYNCLLFIPLRTMQVQNYTR